MKNDTEENDAFQIDHVNTQKENDAWNKEEQKFTRKRRHAEEKLNDRRLKQRKAKIHSQETTRRGETQRR